MKTVSVGFYCVHHFSIVKKLNKDNKNTPNRSKLHTHLPNNFYRLFDIHYKKNSNRQKYNCTFETAW